MKISAFNRVATDDEVESLLRVILTANATLHKKMPKPQKQDLSSAQQQLFSELK